MLFVFLLLKLMLPVAATSCAAASCAATCGRGIAAAALRLAVHRCWAAVATLTLFFFCSTLGLQRCATSSHPSSFSEASPAGFRLPLARTHLNLGGKAIQSF